MIWLKFRFAFYSPTPKSKPSDDFIDSQDFNVFLSLVLHDNIQRESLREMMRIYLNSVLCKVEIYIIDIKFSLYGLKEGMLKDSIFQLERFAELLSFR